MSVVERSDDGCPLTPGELRVLELLMQGLSYSEIATALGRTTSTVRSHLNSAYHRLGVRTSYQAVLKCARAGWLTFSDEDPKAAAPTRDEGVMRELVTTVESHHEEDELTATQRAYLDHLDDYLYAGNEHARRASRARMDEALQAILHEADVTVTGRRGSNDLIADLGAIVTRPRSAAA